MSTNTAELLQPEHSLRKLAIDINPPDGLPNSVWDPAFQRPDVAHRVGMMAYARISHLPFDCGPLKSASELAPWKKREIEVARVGFGAPVGFMLGERAVRAATIGEIFRKFNYGPRGQVCYHAQWVSIGVDSRGAYFLDATVGQVFGSSPTTVGVQVKLMAGNELIGGITWEGTVHPHDNTSLRLLGLDPRLVETFEGLSSAIVEYRMDCKGP